jgi:hypothetical protein
MLVLLIAACAAAVFLEAAWPEVVLLSFARCYFVLLQGTWFCQIGRILFLGLEWWDDSDASYMGATMFLPVVFVTHLMSAALLLLALHLVVVHSLGGRLGALDGVKAIEGAKEGQPFKLALLDLTARASRAASLHLSGHKQ